MSAGAEADQLVRISHVGAALVVLPFELGQIDQHLLWSRFAGERGNRHGLFLSTTKSETSTQQLNQPRVEERCLIRFLVSGSAEGRIRPNPWDPDSTLRPLTG